MAEYQKIEYRIGKNGTIVETVLNATGESCILTTAAIETALGVVEQRELLPDYDQNPHQAGDTLTADLIQQTQN